MAGYHGCFSRSLGGRGFEWLPGVIVQDNHWLDPSTRGPNLKQNRPTFSLCLRIELWLIGRVYEWCDPPVDMGPERDAGGIDGAGSR